MKHLSLAARYRPQTFAEVAGQTLAATALSRAASEMRPAPAYLLSGTRGVGKTTIARIFAKALNCEAGPAPEPCNQCPQCQHITAGNHVDVCEIDGASNTGVDDVRALRENLGYMPMEGKFKIFIIDEAHMLSKSAFNALLKTLEEPPGHTVFIFATTEAHRFPATIISRCQHFIFRHLPEDQILTHLSKILGKENIPFDKGALQLIARRAAGSVRDSLSLLDQTLATSGNNLTVEAARQALGLAGQEFYQELFTALAHADCAKVAGLCRELFSTGIDIGFFVRELAGYMRSLFLWSQGGDAMLPVLGLSHNETEFIKVHAKAFTPGHLHSAWHMILDGQRGIAQSPEPGAALELLLLNLALLPQLLPVGEIKAQPQIAAPAASNAQGCNEAAAQYETEPKEKAAPAWGWDGFIDFCAKQPPEEVPPPNILRLLKGQWEKDKLSIQAGTLSLWDQAQKFKSQLNTALDRYCDGKAPEVFFPKPEAAKSHQEMMEELSKKPEVRLCAEILGAQLEDWRQKPADAMTKFD